MKVYAVGTACSWFERNNTSFIIDDEILFDTPSGSYKNILKKIDIFKIKAIFISHFHTDHFTDLQVFTTRFMRESVKNGRKEKFKIYGPKGTLKHLIDYNTIICASKDERDKGSLTKMIDFVEVENGDEFELGKYKVKVYKMDHGDIYSQGYTFTDENGVTVGFSADTRDCENLRKMLSVSNYAFVDMSALEPVKSHLDIKSFMNLENLYPNCKMFAIHTSDETFEMGKSLGLNVLDDGDIKEL